MQNLEGYGVPLLIEKPIGMEGRFMSVIVAEDKVKSAAIKRQQSKEINEGATTTDQGSLDLSNSETDGKSRNTSVDLATESISSNPQEG